MDAWARYACLPTATALEVDAHLLSMLGYDPSQVAHGRLSLSDLLPESIASQLLAQRQAAISLGLRAFALPDHHLKAQSGRLIPVQHMATVRFDAQGQPVETMDCYQVQAEAPVRDNWPMATQGWQQRQDRYQQLFERTSDAMLILENNIFIECNEATIKMLGYQSKSQFLNTHPAQLSPEWQPDGMRSSDKVLIMNQMAYDQGSHRFEWDHLRSNGEIIPVEVLLTVIPSDRPEDRTLHVVWRDITQRKRAAAAILAQNQLLEESNRELQQFSYIASHDLQEPLRTLVNFSALLDQEYAPTLEGDGKIYLTYVMNASRRMQELVRDLMEYSRIGRERELKQVDMQALAQAVQEDLHTLIREKQATIIVDALPVVPGFLTELRQMLQNLVANALKFSQPGLPPEIRISAASKGSDWEFMVRDNGIGIEPKNHDRIFVIFRRLHRQNEYGGTGIGLAHCKKIVSLHHGKIWITSELGSGSTFHFTIPKTHVL